MILLVAGSALLAHAREIRIGVDQAAPYQSWREGYGPVGFTVDVLENAAKKRGIKLRQTYMRVGKRACIKQARYAQDPEPLDPRCECRVCKRYSRAYLRHLYASNEVLAQVLNTIHNLSFYLDTMRRVRHSISLGEESRSLSGLWSQPKP